ncbi:hypothetical protein DEO72_LG3g545 [Vigna unguiculata]|uniref:Secreted protein n=1 Tax=Vigna unguiculata TaxID=3917 RepID=A0A4D6LCJ1_VIGUN|nr:hypothetical protein DEO72_LG3g545 [Vigna unguiculata]
MVPLSSLSIWSLLNAAAVTFPFRTRALLGFQRSSDSRLAWPLFCSLANRVLELLCSLVLCRKTCADPFPGESRAKTDNLAQASRIRLSELDEGSPKPLCAKGRPSDLLELLSE